MMTFRLHGALLATGDALVGDLGLTSARWQVLGAVALEPQAPTVAQAARRMGLSRQAVQRIANDLKAEGLVRFIDNPDHQRAKRMELTQTGQRAYASAMDRQRRWAEGLARGIDSDDIYKARDLMTTLLNRLYARASVDGSEPENPT